MTTIVTAVLLGVVVLLAGNLPWAGLAPLNFRIGSAVPWAILPMAAYLWAYWRFIGGGWSVSGDATWLRTNLRANRLPARLWAAALAAGALGFAALLALLAVAARLVHLPESAPIVTPPAMPVVTVVLLLVMQSIVAGVTEEAAFRGYMQGPIEREYGLAVAILVNGAAFGLLHFSSHPGDVLMMLPYYIAVAAVYGGLTWAADSILPALVLHSVGDIIVLTRWWATGRPEWQLAATPPPLVPERGVDTAFVGTAISLVVLALLTARAYQAVRTLRVRALARMRRAAKRGEGEAAVSLSDAGGAVDI
jgi:membrane protease YdiL (CAAX protease family)